MGAYRALIDAWLEAEGDALRDRDGCGSDVSRSTVRRWPRDGPHIYVQARRRALARR
jgi:hypothetical protein